MSKDISSYLQVEERHMEHQKGDMTKEQEKFWGWRFIITIVVMASQVHTRAIYFKSIIPQLSYKKKECKISIYLPCTLSQEATKKKKKEATIGCGPQK